MKRRYHKHSREELMRGYKRDTYRREHPERFSLVQSIRTQEKTVDELTDADVGLLLDDMFASAPHPPTTLLLSYQTKTILEEMLERWRERMQREEAMRRLTVRMSGQKRRQKRKQNRRNN